jgi:hypothetical protein
MKRCAKAVGTTALGALALGLVTLAWLYQSALDALCTPCDNGEPRP